jgi:zinc protease
VGAGTPAFRVEDGVHFYAAGGATIVVKPRRASPLVSMAVCCRGGVLNETSATAGITRVMARSSIKGTRTRSSTQLAEETEALGGVIQPSVAADLLQWGLTVPSRHFAAGAELLADAALAPVFPRAEVEREQRNALSDLERLRDDMAEYPTRLCLSAAFGGHPYGFSLEEMEAGTSAVASDDIAAWHERVVTSGSPWVFVVGDVAPDDAVAVLAPLFEDLPPAPPRSQPRRPAWPDRPASREVLREKAQTALALGFPGPDRMDPDLYPLRVLSNAIAGGGGRLFEELRSRQSLAYTVTAYPLARLHAGAFVAYIAMAPERETEARERLLEQLELVAADELREEELRRAQRYTIGAWRIRTQTNGAQLADLARALLLGEGLERLRAFETRINGVTPAAIRTAAARTFDRSRVIEGVVRGSGGGR